MTTPQWRADFESTRDPVTGNYRDLVFQGRTPSRASLVDCKRTGRKALKHTTMPGDEGIVGSGDMRRCDFYKCVPNTLTPDVYYTGSSPQWWAHSVLFPDEFQWPTWFAYNLFDFHNYPENIGGSANAALNFVKDPRSDALPGLLRVQRVTGDRDANGKIINIVDHSAVIGAVERNEWHDFVYHVLWSEKNDGYFYAWHNGRLVMEHTKCPTLYPGCGVYMKLAHYHLPRPLTEQQAPYNWPATPTSAIIHDRVRMGPTEASIKS
jgi:hypothetical protein